METIENGALAIAGKADDGSDAGYAAVRFNALKHGVLSRHVVLPHEDRAEFDELRDALVFEHQPSGATELHLVEELAGVLWRKRRVLMAEGAKINEGLKSAVSSPQLVMPSAAPFQRGLTGENADLRDLLDATPEEIVERQQQAALDLAATQKAVAILRRGGPSAYSKARRALIQDSRDWWDQQVEEDEHPATAEGLAQFIRDSLEPICHQMLREAQYTPAIRAQTLGEGLRAHLLEKLNRYETHLDRKFERTLAKSSETCAVRETGDDQTPRKASHGKGFGKTDGQSGCKLAN